MTHSNGILVRPASDGYAAQVAETEVPPTVVQLGKWAGPVVYFARTDDGLVRISYTKDIAKRRREIGATWHQVVAVVRGNRADCQALHARFATHLARGETLYNMAAPILAHVNDIRARMGVKPITA